MQTFAKIKALVVKAAWVFPLLFAGLFYTSSAFAAAPEPSILVRNFGILGEILQTVSIIMGLGMLLGVFFDLKRYGESRNHMSQQYSLAAPLTKMLAGVALLGLPTALASALWAFWTSSSPLQYNGGNSDFEQYIPAILVFVRLIGAGSFIRGIVLLARSGQSQQQPGQLSKAFLHIFGGILLVHILGTVALVKEIFNFT